MQRASKNVGVSFGVRPLYLVRHAVEHDECTMLKGRIMTWTFLPP